MKFWLFDVVIKKNSFLTNLNSSFVIYYHEDTPSWGRVHRVSTRLSASYLKHFFTLEHSTRKYQYVTIIPCWQPITQSGPATKGAGGAMAISLFCKTLELFSKSFPMGVQFSPGPLLSNLCPSPCQFLGK